MLIIGEKPIAGKPTYERKKRVIDKQIVLNLKLTSRTYLLSVPPGKIRGFNFNFLQNSINHQIHKINQTAFKTYNSSATALNVVHHGFVLSNLVTGIKGFFWSHSIVTPSPASLHHFLKRASNSFSLTLTFSRISNTTANSGGTTLSWTPPYRTKNRNVKFFWYLESSAYIVHYFCLYVASLQLLKISFFSEIKSKIFLPLTCGGCKAMIVLANRLCHWN